MTTPPNAPDSSIDSQGTAPAVFSEARPMYWSVRRELWENRSIYIAPVIVACVFLFAVFFYIVRLAHKMRALSALDWARQREITGPYNALAGGLVVTAFIVGVFYCLDALYGERRDRSILFWKSMPVSDRTTVLSKASIPLLVLPLFIFALIVASHFVILTLSTLALMGSDAGPAPLWRHLPLIQIWFAVLYGLIAITLWHAPIYAWLLLVSGWTRRATFLWAVLPLLVVAAAERIAFNTSLFGSLLRYRLVGWFPQAFAVQPKGSPPPMDPLTTLTPGKFLTTPGLWIGLVFAAAFLVVAVRLRRDREPI